MTPENLVNNFLSNLEKRSSFDNAKQAIKKLKQSQADLLFEKIAGLSKIQRRILNYILYMVQRVRTVYVSQSWIAKIAGCCRQWANECIKILKNLGLIVSKRRNYYYGWKTNIYGIAFNFTNPEISRELYTLLSSLRGFSKKTTLLKNDNINIKNINIQNHDIQSIEPPNGIKASLVVDESIQLSPQQPKIATCDRGEGIETLGDVFANLFAKQEYKRLAQRELR